MQDLHFHVVGRIGPARPGRVAVANFTRNLHEGQGCLVDDRLLRPELVETTGMRPGTGVPNASCFQIGLFDISWPDEEQ